MDDYNPPIQPLEDITIKFGKNSFIHPSYGIYCLNWQAKNWQKPVQDKAVQIWQLGTFLRHIEVGVIIDIVEGSRTMTVEETDDADYLIISEKEKK
jgi:hypothetical protein|tara:strand:+ start:1547 stop:1834 length:288 start_codon:yes stop_codon:yes gene_type:complete